MRPVPYIGFSAPMSRAEVDAARAVFHDCGRQLMIGPLASSKTLAGQRNRWWRRTPPVERIAGIFVDDPRCLNLVHYSSDTPGSWDELRHLDEVSGHLCHGFQFNVTWPLVCDLLALEIHRMRRSAPTRIVLQAGPKMLAECERAKALIDRIRPYSHVATDVLIDFSGGRGQPIDAWKAGLTIEMLRVAFPDLGVVVAGGLSAETVPGIAHLIRHGASCDAEGRLRDDADGGGDLVQERVVAYLRAVGEAAGR